MHLNGVFNKPSRGTLGSFIVHNALCCHLWSSFCFEGASVCLLTFCCVSCFLFLCFFVFFLPFYALSVCMKLLSIFFFFFSPPPHSSIHFVVIKQAVSQFCNESQWCSWCFILGILVNLQNLFAIRPVHFLETFLCVCVRCAQNHIHEGIWALCYVCGGLVSCFCSLLALVIGASGNF